MVSATAIPTYILTKYEIIQFLVYVLKIKGNTRVRGFFFKILVTFIGSVGRNHMILDE